MSSSPTFRHLIVHWETYQRVFCVKKERCIDQDPCLSLKTNTTFFFNLRDTLYMMQCNVFYYRLMMDTLDEDSEKEKEINKFQRSSCSHMFFKIGIFKNFVLFTGNSCVGVSSMQLCKKKTPVQHKCFLMNTAKNHFIELLLWSFFFATM